ncbi:MAG: type II toxin-antitoxin system RelE/ParE family toxin [Planctomycetota bacterium]|nr:type II toxin-antitoxin system RelE/ParE family toxin [Planctomycetota bacterium]
MTYRVAITDRAFGELDSACKWWSENRSAEQALRWYKGFIQSIRSLANNPERRPLAPENHAFPHEVRQLVYGVGHRPTHRAVFTMRSDLVLVLRVRHLAQKEISPDD